MTNCLAPPYVVARLDPGTGEVGESIALPDVPAGVAFGNGDLWVALLPPSHPPGTVLRIDPATKQILKQFQVGVGAEYVAFGEGALWVGNADEGTVSRIDAKSDRVTTIPVGTQPFQIAVGDGYVWVNNRDDRSISKIDPLEERVVDIIHEVRGALAVDGSNLWVADPETPTLWRIDTITDEVTAEFDLHYSGFIAVGAGSIWVAEAVSFEDQCCL